MCTACSPFPARDPATGDTHTHTRTTSRKTRGEQRCDIPAAGIRPDNRCCCARCPQPQDAPQCRTETQCPALRRAPREDGNQSSKRPFELSKQIRTQQFTHREATARSDAVAEGCAELAQRLQHDTTPTGKSAARNTLQKLVVKSSMSPHLSENERQAGVVVAANDGNAARRRRRDESSGNSNGTDEARQVTSATGSWLTGCEAAPAAGSAA